MRGAFPACPRPSSAQSDPVPFFFPSSLSFLVSSFLAPPLLGETFQRPLQSSFTTRKGGCQKRTESQFPRPTMSFFQRVFGSGTKGRRAQSTGEAIRRLTDTEELLTKKQEYLEEKIKQELCVARRDAKTNKRSALQALKRKKQCERQLRQVDGTLATTQQQREALQGAYTNTAVLTTMGEAAKALKEAHAGMDADLVHDLLDDIAEQRDVAGEISDAISSGGASGRQFDEEELEAELRELEAEGDVAEQEGLDRQLLAAGPRAADRLPEVSATESTAGAKPNMGAGDADLADLAVWAS